MEQIMVHDGWGTAPVQELRVETCGFPTHLYVAGQGPAVVLIHGLGSGPYTWQPTLAGLADRFTLIMPDLPGHGNSGSPEWEFGLELSGPWLAALLDALEVPSATVVGTSLGGAVALASALDRPDRVQRLVLEDSAGLGKEIIKTLRLLTLPIIGPLLARPGRRQVEATVERVVRHSPSIPSQRVEAMVTERLTPEHVRSWLSILRKGVNIWGVKESTIYLDRLPRLRPPTLIIWGADDPVFPVSHGRRAAEIIPDARLRIIPNCGHWPHLEQAQAFNALLAEFLDQEATGAARPAHS